MVLPSSGTISLNDVNVELGKSGTTTASMGSDEFRALAASGTAFTPYQIGMNEFYGDARPYYTYNNSYSSGSNASSYTFSSSDIGSANSGRVVVVLFFNSGSNSGHNPTCTIGGVSANRRVFVDPSNGNSASLFTLPVTTGTTATIVVSAGVVTNRCGISVYSVYYTKDSDDGTYETNSTTGQDTSATLTFTEHPFYGNYGGIFIGGIQTFDNTQPSFPTRTWSTNTGNTISDDVGIRHSDEVRIHNAASYRISSANGTNNQITCTFDTSRVYEGVGAVFY